MISYSQNYEDVVLERCFADVANGFYIDVGAWDPFEHSVTHHFYQRGWNGINIEPNPEYFERLIRDRHRDINLQLALGETDQESLTFTVLKGSGISTLRGLPDSYLDNLASRGYDQEPTVVSTTTLAAVCRDHVPTGREIEFMKIDVEGWEEQVIRGHDWQQWRPKVLVIEAIAPVAFDEDTGRDLYSDLSDTWEPIVLANGYLPALNDGLNRFFVREESSELLAHLLVPANCLDGAEQYPTWAWRHELIEAQEEIGRLVVQLDEQDRKIETLRREIDSIEQAARALGAELHAQRARADQMEESTSWRITRPVRALGDLRHRP